MWGVCRGGAEGRRRKRLLPAQGGRDMRVTTETMTIRKPRVGDATLVEIRDNIRTTGVGVSLYPAPSPSRYPYPRSTFQGRI